MKTEDVLPLIYTSFLCLAPYNDKVAACSRAKADDAKSVRRSRKAADDGGIAAVRLMTGCPTHGLFGKPLCTLR
jgi:hypothetical protein